jgi:hypothetical protein
MLSDWIFKVRIRIFEDDSKCFNSAIEKMELSFNEGGLWIKQA